MKRYVLPELKYASDDLEPIMDEETLILHHTKHHQGYIDNLNLLLENKLNGFDDDNFSQKLLFNAGGHINHSIFWESLAPYESDETDIGNISIDFMRSINDAFGSFQQFKEIFHSNGLTIQGSGWCWLVYNMHNDKLRVVTTFNQDPIIGAERVLFGVDVWEHAYYLLYKNNRKKYLDEIWNVMNWKQINRRWELYRAGNNILADELHDLIILLSSSQADGSAQVKEISVRLCSPTANLPSYQSAGASGMDLYADIEEEHLSLNPGECVKINTGIAFALPQSLEGQVRSRSGLASLGICVISSPGTIDSDYRGELSVPLFNVGKEKFIVKKNMRIAQLVISPVIHCKLKVVHLLCKTDRGTSGFGSSGYF